MAVYVDGFVVPVPKKNLAAYRKIARLAAKVWKEHGALEYRETIADDLDASMGSWSKSLKLKPDETVAFSWITYKSKADRKRVTKLVMEDERLAHEAKDMPFDYKRMLYGGFKTLVEL